MQNAKFMTLTGHLSECPLPVLIDILRRRRNTGRLLIDYPTAPCAFFFKDGELVDSRIGTLEGLQAVVQAVNMPDSPFNFNPSIQPSEQSINNTVRKLVLRMIGCLDYEVIINSEAERKATVVESADAIKEGSDVPRFQRVVLPREGTPPPVPVVGNYNPISVRNRVLIIAGALLLLCVIPPIVALTDIFDGKPAPPPATGTPEPDGAKGEVTSPTASVIGASGLSELTDGDIESVGTLPARKKARQSPSTPTLKKSGAVVGSPAEPLPSSPPPTQKAEAPPPVRESAPPGGRTITVVTHVENGRVVEAYVANRRPGMEAFEASALRAARQRHFPPGTKGSEKVEIKVSKH